MQPQNRAQSDECNLMSIMRKKRYVKYGEALHRYPNLLDRYFAAERLDQKRATDTSYIRIGQRFLYLPIIHALYDNSIVAYKTGTEQNNSLMLNTIKTVGQLREKAKPLQSCNSTET